MRVEADGLPRIDFAGGSKNFVLMVRREGTAAGEGAFAGSKVVEHGWHDIQPRFGGDPQGNLELTAPNGDTTYLKCHVRAAFMQGEGKPEPLDNGLRELVSGSGGFAGLRGVGTLVIKPASEPERLFVLEGELCSAPFGRRRSLRGLEWSGLSVRGSAMRSRWLVTPFYFEHPEPALFTAAPARAEANAPGRIADRSPGALARMHRPIAAFAERAARAGLRPVSLAGDCCASVPVMAGLAAAGVEATLVWIDAHGDFNTPETSPSQFLGGMPLAMMAGRGPQWMCEAVGLSPIDEERIWLVDGRDLDPLEREALDSSGVRRASVAEIAGLDLSGPVCVHIDLDVIDAAEAPGFNYPVPGGPGAEETAAACAALAARADIRAVSISGWTEARDRSGRTGAACRRVLRALTGEGPGR